MEERFNLDINNEEAEKISTVNDAVDIFAKYMTEKINREHLNDEKK
jgi:acyl carrier protein